MPSAYRASVGPHNVRKACSMLCQLSVFSLFFSIATLDDMMFVRKQLADYTPIDLYEQARFQVCLENEETEER